MVRSPRRRHRRVRKGTYGLLCDYRGFTTRADPFGAASLYLAVEASGDDGVSLGIMPKA